MFSTNFVQNLIIYVFTEEVFIICIVFV
jgi:F0F1-type ATP synthase membrane subunit c/vacuolar-type H+-ATPase subunit K